MNSGIGSRSSPIVLSDDDLFDETNLGTKSLPILLSSDDEEDEGVIEAALAIRASPLQQKTTERPRELSANVTKSPRKSSGVAWDIMYNMGYTSGQGLGTRMKGSVFPVPAPVPAKRKRGVGFQGPSCSPSPEPPMTSSSAVRLDTPEVSHAPKKPKLAPSPSTQQPHEIPIPNPTNPPSPLSASMDFEEYVSTLSGFAMAAMPAAMQAAVAADPMAAFQIAQTYFNLSPPLPQNIPNLHLAPPPLPMPLAGPSTAPSIVPRPLPPAKGLPNTQKVKEPKKKKEAVAPESGKPKDPKSCIGWIIQPKFPNRGVFNIDLDCKSSQQRHWGKMHKPNVACCLVMEDLPGIHRSVAFVKTWSDQFDPQPSFGVVDSNTGKALIEFQSHAAAEAAYYSPRLHGGIYVKAQHVRVFWYRPHEEIKDSMPTGAAPAHNPKQPKPAIEKAPKGSLVAKLPVNASGGKPDVMPKPPPKPATLLTKPYVAELARPPPVIRPMLQHTSTSQSMSSQTSGSSSEASSESYEPGEALEGGTGSSAEADSGIESGESTGSNGSTENSAYAEPIVESGEVPEGGAASSADAGSGTESGEHTGSTQYSSSSAPTENSSEVEYSPPDPSIDTPPPRAESLLEQRLRLQLFAKRQIVLQGNTASIASCSRIPMEVDSPSMISTNAPTTASTQRHQEDSAIDNSRSLLLESTVSRQLYPKPPDPSRVEVSPPPKNAGQLHTYTPVTRQLALHVNTQSRQEPPESPRDPIAAPKELAISASLESLATSFITETIHSAQEQVAESEAELRARAVRSKQASLPTATPNDILSRQQTLAQQIAESKLLMQQYQAATTKEEKDRIMQLLKEQTRATGPSRAPTQRTEQAVAARFCWPQSSHSSVLVVSDDEDDDMEES